MLHNVLVFQHASVSCKQHSYRYPVLLSASLVQISNTTESLFDTQAASQGVSKQLVLPFPLRVLLSHVLSQYAVVLLHPLQHQVFY